MDQLTGGVVVAYDPDTKTYSVSLDGRPVVVARRIMNGADKPFPARARVVCGRTTSGDWLILGELDTPQRDPDLNRPRTADEAAADLDARVRGLSDPTLGTPPPFRPVGEEPQFPGDVSLENRTADQRARSRVKIYSFGAILVQASKLCFALWNKRDSQLLVSARDWVFRMVGFTKTITTRVDDPRTTIREELAADLLATTSESATKNKPVRIDRESFEGFVPAPAGRASAEGEWLDKPAVERGRRTKLMDYRVVEDDHDAQARRERMDFVERDADGKATKRTTEFVQVVGALDGSPATAKHGAFTRYRDWLAVEIDDEAHVATVTHLRGPAPYRFILTDDHVAIERGEQFLRFDDDGLTIRAKAVQMTADGDITETAGGRHHSRGAEVHHN